MKWREIVTMVSGPIRLYIEPILLVKRFHAADTVSGVNSRKQIVGKYCASTVLRYTDFEILNVEIRFSFCTNFFYIREKKSETRQ